MGESLQARLDALGKRNTRQHLPPRDDSNQQRRTHCIPGCIRTKLTVSSFLYDVLSQAHSRNLVLLTFVTSSRSTSSPPSRRYDYSSSNNSINGLQSTHTIKDVFCLAFSFGVALLTLRHVTGSYWIDLLAEDSPFFFTLDCSNHSFLFADRRVHTTMSLVSMLRLLPALLHISTR
jgi:hypothetical protein